MSYPVKLRPPPNVTVEMGSDSNLWVYWNQTKPVCEESMIRYRTKNRKWDVSSLNKRPFNPQSFFFILYLIIVLVYKNSSCRPQESPVSTGRNLYCINMPSSSSAYEVQVRRKYGRNCGESEYWSDWSEPVVWGSNNSTGTNCKMSAVRKASTGKNVRLYWKNEVIADVYNIIK